MSRRLAVLLLALPVLLGAAPAPQGFVAGVSGISRALDGVLDDARAVGFGAVRVFLRWDKIETIEGAPDWSCRFLTSADLGPGGAPWPGIPCDGTPCGCGYSADERVADAARGPVMLTLVGTPDWAAGAPAPQCPIDAPLRALPLRAGKTSAFHAFAAQVARRYGDVAYAFELWNEPDLAACRSWAGTIQQYREQILDAATAVKATGVVPGLVVAPTLEDPSGDAMDAWMDWSQPVDLLSFNVYRTTVGGALEVIDTMNRWCAANRRCPGFYVTEYGAQSGGPSNCPGPRTNNPGAGNVAVMKRCRKRRWCHGIFLYALSDQNRRSACDRGLFTETGCAKRRMCTMARRFFGTTFRCGRCGA